MKVYFWRQNPNGSFSILSTENNASVPVREICVVDKDCQHAKELIFDIIKSLKGYEKEEIKDEIIKETVDAIKKEFPGMDVRVY